MFFQWCDGPISVLLRLFSACQWSLMFSLCFMSTFWISLPICQLSKKCWTAGFHKFRYCLAQPRPLWDGSMAVTYNDFIVILVPSRKVKAFWNVRNSMLELLPAWLACTRTMWTIEPMVEQKIGNLPYLAEWPMLCDHHQPAPLLVF